MYLIKKIATRKVRMHSDDSWDEKAYAPKGTEYFQVCNGTIGKGARYRNYSMKAMGEILELPLEMWSKRIERDSRLKLVKGA